MVTYSNFVVITAVTFLSAMLVIVIYRLQLVASKEASKISRYISITDFSIHFMFVHFICSLWSSYFVFSFEVQV
jgi:phosphate starvation-inducible membrane PsiE